MKPLFLAVTAITSSTALFAVSQLSGYADSDHYSPQQLLAALPNTTTTPLIWVELAADSDLSVIARELDLSLNELAKLNEQSVSTVLKAGTLVVLPEPSRGDVVDSSRFVADSLRTTAPLSSPPTPQDVVEIKSDQSLSSFVRDHGITLEQLKDLNPGVQLSRMLVIGNKVRVAKARPLLGMRPLRSGGASWPDLPGFSGSDQFHSSQTFIWPTKGVFTSGYGWRWGRMHKGIDIANNVGTPIFAAKDGVIAFAGWSGAYGYLVEMSHGDGSSTRYAHNSRLLVKKGQMVPQGSRISLMGSTGRSTGPHLHFEIRRPGGAALDPMAMLPARRS
jgi:murein DD-endopeptidase MepM/ murein hydrolase activator NlpD